MALYSAIVALFGIDVPTPDSNVVSSLLAALVVGLLFLWADLPAHSAAYNSNQPHTALEGMALGDLPVTRANLYFYLLDTKIEPVIRNRALYIGSVFRIGFELIYLLILVPTGVLLVASSRPDLGPGRDSSSVDQLAAIAIAVALIIFLMAILLGLGRSPQEGVKASLKDVFTRFRRQLTRGDWGGLGVAALLTASAAVFDIGLLSLTGVVVAASLWAHRYFRGYEASNGRRNLDPPAATFMLLLTIGLLTLHLSQEVESVSPLGAPQLMGWLGLILFAGLVIISRGPERKLHGAYASQRGWLLLNSNDLWAFSVTGDVGASTQGAATPHVKGATEPADTGSTRGTGDGSTDPA